MPMPYEMRTPPQRYPLDRNDKIGLALGALLSGGLAAASSGNTGENPILRAIAGGVTGMGAGGKQLNDSYSAMLDDYLKNESMNFRDRQMTQEQQQFQDTLGFNREKFGEEKRQYEETVAPESKAKIESYNKFGYFGNPPASIIEDQYSQGLTPERKQEFNRYASPVTVPMLAEMAAGGDGKAKAALSQVSVPVFSNTDQGMKLIDRRTGDVKDTGLTQKPEISDTSVEKFGMLGTLQQSVNDLQMLSEKVSMGPLAGRLEQAKGKWFNNLSSEDQLEFNTVNQQIFNLIGELRSGKVLTENEMSRLLAELPHQNLPYNTYKVRLKMLNRHLGRTLENKLKTYEQGNFNVEGFGVKPSSNILNEQVGKPKEVDPFSKYWK